MVHVFTFLGEFGYELLNWQGVVRKWARTRASTGKIVCASRAHVSPLYEMADLYVDLGEVELFKSSRAVQYSAARTLDRVSSLRDLAFDRTLKAELRAYIGVRLREAGLLSEGEECRFVFSSDGVRLDGCAFGHVSYRYRPLGVLVSDVCGVGKRILPNAATDVLYRVKRTILESVPPLDYRGDGDIYARLNLENNLYQRIEPDPGVRGAVEEQLGFGLDEPFVLCQTRRRDSPQVSADGLDTERVQRLLKSLAVRVRVVLLSFSTGRLLDSYSAFAQAKGCFAYRCHSFPEQASLIRSARHCLFFSEGDLGSHTYLPPMMGRDVTVVAPGSVFQLESAPVDFWNRHVFHFGGRMIPEVAETAFKSEASLEGRVIDRVEAGRSQPALS